MKKRKKEGAQTRRDSSKTLPRQIKQGYTAKNRRRGEGKKVIKPKEKSSKGHITKNQKRMTLQKEEGKTTKCPGKNMRNGERGKHLGGEGENKKKLKC